MSDEPRDGTGEPGPVEPFDAEVSSMSQEPPTTRALRRPSRTQLLAAGIVLIGVVAVLLGLMVFAPSIAPIKLGSARSAGETSETKDVAARFARNLLTIDYRTVDADFAAMRKDATGTMLRKLSSLAKVVKEPFRESRSISKGTVTGVEVVSQTPETAQVKISASVVIQNVKSPEPRTVKRTVELTLVKTVAGWKVSDADAVGQSS